MVRAIQGGAFLTAAALLIIERLMKAVIVTVGDEILIGQITNTNASWIGEQLGFTGIDVVQHVSVGDTREAIILQLDDAFRRAELVVVTGGLGPTHDDITKLAVADYFGFGLQLDESVLEAIRLRFQKRGRTMPESNRIQAMVPESFAVLPNPVGTAPGLWFADEQEGRERLLVVTPGVPHEMRHLMTHEALPRLREHKGLRIIAHRNLLTTGIGESALQEKIGDLSAFLAPDLRLAFLPNASGVRLRLTAHGETSADVKDRLDRFEAFLRSRIEKYIFGMNDDTLEGVVGKLLLERGLTVAVAESCTGGYVLNRLTNAAGASAYVIGGVVAYCNQVKREVLGVDADVLAEEGAVSEKVAQQMAAGIRERLGTSIGVSTTGIAGPTGGTPEKPVGLVWVGYADEKEVKAFRFQLAEERLLNKELTNTAVLDLIRIHLLGRG